MIYICIYLHMQDGKATTSVAAEPFLGHIEYQEKSARIDENRGNRI